MNRRRPFAAAPISALLFVAAWAAALASGGGRSVGLQPAEPAEPVGFAFVGDTGTGHPRAQRVAAAIRRQAGEAPLSHLFLLGDNVYEDGEAHLIGPRFLDVYRPVLDLGVRIHAALGNHDVHRCRDSGARPVARDAAAYREAPDCWVREHLATPEFGYPEGARYYSVEIPRGTPLVEVFVLDSNTLGADQTKLSEGRDEPQLDWLAAALGRSRARRKIVAMHHVMAAPERCWWLGLFCRGDDPALRAQLEPLFLEHGVDAVFQGHQHFYARLKPQRGVHYFVSGAGGKSPDAFRSDPRTVPRRDRGDFNHFVVLRATADELDFLVIDADGRTRDRGTIASGDPTGRPR